MKKICFTNCLLAIAMSMGMVSCSDLLIEEPKTEFTPDYFKTGQGLQAGLSSSYSSLRWLFGPGGSICVSINGTDEFHHTKALTGGEAEPGLYSTEFTPSNSQMGNYWNNGIAAINNCNGLIEYGAEAADLSETERTALIAEARFLRGLFYYIVTMNYGGVPLDLGSGRLAFNTKPSTLSVRNSRDEVFEAIIEDFLYAKANLPDKPATGRAAKPAAIHFLAKAYLSRAGLADCTKVPSATDYQSAYTTAKELIDNKGAYGVDLQSTYAEVHKEGNENGIETLFSVQRPWSSTGSPNYVFAEAEEGAGNLVSNKGNRTNYFFEASYESVRANGIAIVPRSIEYQRPWRMVMPTKWLIFEAFADKDNDSRWNASWRTEWKAGAEFTMKGQTVKVGELAIKVTLEETQPALGPNDSLDAISGVIYRPYVNYWWGMLYENDVYKQDVVQYMYPSLKKYDDTKRAALNYESVRPLMIARLAETYLIAAEAALLGNAGASEAANLINVVRTRAYANAADHTLENVSPGDVTIDYILDERSREMCGEFWRWTDLVRTGKLVERVKAHNYLAAPNIQAHHALRPIPQTQIDLMSDAGQKATYQNPGYN